MRTNYWYTNFALVVGLMIHLTSAAQSTKTNIQANYHNRDCIGGSGFCSASNEIFKSATGNTVIERVSSRYVTFSVNRNSFTEAQMMQLFGVPSNEIDPDRMYEFDQNVDIILDPDILSAIGAGSSFNLIHSQPYPMVLKNGFVCITFLLSQ